MEKKLTHHYIELLISPSNGPLYTKKLEMLLDEESTFVLSEGIKLVTEYIGKYGSGNMKINYMNNNQNMVQSFYTNIIGISTSIPEYINENNEKENKENYGK